MSTSRVLCSAFLLLALCATPAQEVAPRVSLVQLLSNPDEFDGRRIAVVGFAAFQFEEKALYLNREHYEAFIPESAIWIVVDSETLRRSKKWHKKYVEVTGVFDAGNPGHMSAYAGAMNLESVRLRRFKGR